MFHVPCFLLHIVESIIALKGPTEGNCKPVGLNFFCINGIRPLRFRINSESVEPLENREIRQSQVLCLYKTILHRTALYGRFAFFCVLDRGWIEANSWSGSGGVC
jgi:hypothetical protein